MQIYNESDKGDNIFIKKCFRLILKFFNCNFYFLASIEINKQPVVQTTLKFPLMAGGTKMVDSASLPPPPQHNAASIGPGNAYFGGRMTEKRLKEVGRMTKETIEHLHKYKLVLFCLFLFYLNFSLFIFRFSLIREMFV